MSWYLDNVYDLNKESPYTFYIPSSEVLDKLKVGDLVKLIFVTEEAEDDGFRGERMWVQITHIKEKKFIGKLDNVPHRLPLKIGDEISFGIENICDTEYEDPNSTEWDFYFDTLVTVSEDVLEKREFNFMIKDYPNGEGDSGWSILSGYEDENFQIVSVGVILNIDDSILEFIQEPPLCAYERNDEGEFYKIDDYDWESYVNG
ncbi:immunity protein Imm33 domain-containing protein [Aneurinibacillus sp. REN35]|uniref:immunity protein Imm33 domain-containing protein n=1 Tax=Aneurinibacillus sp. REN35 TaxID=3237286 RepID=UPI003528269B